MNAPTATTEAPTRVPFVRLDNGDQALMDELLATVADVAARGAFTLGAPVEQFEREFADWCGSKYAVGVSSGTAALELALRALEIGPGDEVIVPTNSFIATAEAVSAVGAIPRLVDVDAETSLLTAAQLNSEELLRWMRTCRTLASDVLPTPRSPIIKRC